MTDLYNAQPPPQYWYLLIRLQEDGNPAQLKHARNIINSYLEPNRQWLRKRIMKGVHEYKLRHIDCASIDRSIFNVVRSELLNDATITREERPCQD